MLPAINLHAFSSQSKPATVYISTQIDERVKRACGTFQALTAMTQNKAETFIFQKIVKSY